MIPNKSQSQELNNVLFVVVVVVILREGAESVTIFHLACVGRK